MSRRLRAMGYATKRGLARITTSPAVTTAVVCAIAASVVAIGVLRLGSHNLQTTTARSTDGPALIVYLNAGVGADRAASIGSALSQLQGTSAVDVVSAEQAKARLELELSGDTTMLSDLDETFFPVTIEVALRPGVREVATLHPFVSRLKGIDGVESVDVLGNAVDRAAGLVGSIRSAVRLLSLFLTGCAMFVVVVLIRLSSGQAVHERRLYLHLGATTAFAVAPELIAGALRGLLGGLVAAAALYAFFVAMEPSASKALAHAIDAPRLVFLPALEILALPLGGVVLGLVGTAAAGQGRSRASG